MTFQIDRKAGTYHASFSIYTFSYVFSACLVCLYIETEQHDVSVFYHIVFSLQTDQTLFFGCCVTSACDQIIIRYNLCTDKSSFKVRMDLSSCLRCLCSFCDRPCTDFRLTCCQVTDKSKQFIACFDQFFQTRLFLIQDLPGTSSSHHHPVLKSLLRSLHIQRILHSALPWHTHEQPVPLRY